MKKILSLVIAVLMVSLFTLSSCDSQADGPKAESNGIISWASHLYDKPRTDAKAPKGTSAEYEVTMAKNETEGCILQMFSETQIKKVKFKQTSADIEGISVSSFIMDKSHKLNRIYYADAATPYYGKMFPVKENTVLPMIVEFTTEPDIAAGEYEYTFAFIDSDDKELASYSVKLRVWNITIPEERTFETAAGVWINEIIRVHGHVEGIYEQYYEMALEHGLSAYDLPYDILDERADKYMSDPRVTSFRVPTTNKSDAELLEYYEKLKTNPDWLKKAYFYPIDEPDTLEELVECKDECERLKALCPEIRITIPYYTNLRTNTNEDQTEYLMGVSDLMCPKLCFWNDEMAYEGLGYKPAKTFEERLKQRQELGEKVWTYVCNAPTEPYITLFSTEDGYKQRIMFWQMFERGIDGFLYYGMDMWTFGDNPSIDPWNTLNNGCKTDGEKPAYGDGILFYPGVRVGIPGPVPSIRLKIVRDGIEDYELFLLAEAVLGEEWVNEKMNSATPSLTEVAVDSDGLYDIRREIGDALEKALSEQ